MNDYIEIRIPSDYRRHVRAFDVMADALKAILCLERRRDIYLISRDIVLDVLRRATNIPEGAQLLGFSFELECMALRCVMVHESFPAQELNEQIERVRAIFGKEAANG